MSKEDVEKAVQEAEKYAEEDKKRREDVETRNGAEQACYQIENSLTEMGDKLTAEEKAPVEEQLNAVKEALKGTDTAAIKEAADELQQRFYKIAEKVYQQTQASQQGGVSSDAASQASQNSAPGGDGYVEADYEVSDDNDSK